MTESCSESIISHNTKSWQGTNVYTAGFDFDFRLWLFSLGPRCCRWASWISRGSGMYEVSQQAQPWGNIFQLSMLDILLKPQSCRGNMRVLTSVPEHRAQRESPCLHSNRGSTTMVLGWPGKRESPGDCSRKYHSRTLPFVVLTWGETLLRMYCTIWNSYVKTPNAMCHFYFCSKKWQQCMFYLSPFIKINPQMCISMILALYLSVSVLCNLIFYCISEANIVVFTPQYLYKV